MQSNMILALIIMFGGLMLLAIFYLYEWYSVHNTKYIQNLEERCKNLEMQVTQLKQENQQGYKTISSLLDQNQRLKLSINGNDIELQLAFNRQDKEIQKLKETIEILRENNQKEQFERDWERNIGNGPY